MSNEASQPTSFEFDDLSLKELPVKIGSESYTLREAGAFATYTFRNLCHKSTIFDEKGEFKEISIDTRSTLLSLCLFKNDLPVPVEVIRNFPNRVIDPMVKWVRDVSELNYEADTQESIKKQIAELESKLKKLSKGDPAKNEQSGTTGGSA